MLQAKAAMPKNAAKLAAAKGWMSLRQAEHAQRDRRAGKRQQDGAD